jgi:hypothetical protein
VQCGLRTLCSHPLGSFGCVSSRTLAFRLTDVFVFLLGGCKILSAYETAEVYTLAVAITLLDKGNGESILSVEALAAIANETVAGSPRLGFVRYAYVHPGLPSTAVHKYKSVLENKLCWDITEVQSLDLCTEGKTYGLQVMLPMVNRHSAEFGSDATVTASSYGVSKDTSAPATGFGQLASSWVHRQPLLGATTHSRQDAAPATATGTATVTATATSTATGTATDFANRFPMSLLRGFLLAKNFPLPTGPRLGDRLKKSWVNLVAANFTRLQLGSTHRGQRYPQLNSGGRVPGVTAAASLSGRAAAAFNQQTARPAAATVR